MQNYSLLFTYNKDNKILDLLNNEIENEIIYTSEVKDGKIGNLNIEKEDLICVK